MFSWPFLPVFLLTYENEQSIGFIIYLQLSGLRCHQDWFTDYGLSNDYMLLAGLFTLCAAQWWVLKLVFFMETMWQSGLFSVLSVSRKEGFFLRTSSSMAIPIHSRGFSATGNDCRHRHNIFLFSRKAGIQTYCFLHLWFLLLNPSVIATAFKRWREGCSGCVSSRFHRHQHCRVSCTIRSIELVFLL